MLGNYSHSQGLEANLRRKMMSWLSLQCDCTESRPSLSLYLAQHLQDSWDLLPPPSLPEEWEFAHVFYFTSMSASAVCLSVHSEIRSVLDPL